MSNLEKYVPLVHFLGEALGEDCEVVLHDLTDPETSIIAIHNGHLSGRKVGGPVTDFVLRILKRREKEHVAYLANYRGKGRDCIFKSSSYFIDDEKGNPIGILCINMDITPYLQAKEFIDKKINQNLESKDGTPLDENNPEKAVLTGAIENLQGNVEDLIESMIESRLQEFPCSRERLSVEERMQLVNELNTDGLFLLRGGVSALSRCLGVSDPTVYRYLSQVKKEKRG